MSKEPASPTGAFVVYQGRAYTHTMRPGVGVVLALCPVTERKTTIPTVRNRI